MGRMGRENIHSGGNVLPVPVLFRAFLFLLLLSPALGGCAPRNMRETAQVSPDREQNQPASPSQSDASDHPVSEIIWTDEGTGGLLGGLSDGQRALIEEYISRYYGALMTFEEPDFSDLFASDAGVWRNLHEQAMAYLIGLRSMQRTDLQLAGYRSELALEESAEISGDEENSRRITLTETSTQNFAEHPEVDSVLYGIRHTFDLVQENGRWLIKGHTQWDGIFWNMMRELGEDGLEERTDGEAYFAARRETLLEEAREEMELRLEDGSGQDTLPPQGTERGEAREERSSAEAELMPYDGEAAASYGASFVGQRNADWWDYSRQGGNCQNFVSQCLYAGGIPMDVRGGAVWKWYGEAVNDLEEDRGCSASWINVDSFYQYVQENEGYGLAAGTDGSYWEGDVGDVILMGPAHDLNHSVLISKVVQNAQGRTVDYLIHSNTSDVKDFPVSAYPNPRQVLVRILGWRTSGESD